MANGKLGLVQGKTSVVYGREKVNYGFTNSVGNELTFACGGSFLAPHGHIDRTTGMHRVATARSPNLETFLTILLQFLAVVRFLWWEASIVAILYAALQCFDLVKRYLILDLVCPNRLTLNSMLELTLKYSGYIAQFCL